AVGGHLNQVRNTSFQHITRQGIGPAGQYIMLLYLVVGQANGLCVGNEFKVKHILEAGFTADHRHLYAINQIDGKSVGDRGDEVEPVGGKLWSHYRYADNGASEITHFRKL